MESLHLPEKIELHEGSTPFIAELVVEPCYQGYGTTLGNALRRVLLSSLPGAAVVAIKIQGVDHEFSPVANVKEDVIQIILSLKRLRLKVFSEETVRLHLSAKGECVVTAADITPSSDIEIINKDLVIATLTSKASNLEMDIFVRQGRGYVPIEERTKESLEIGTIAIDAIFTPIKNVGYRVDDVRVGQITNFDRLVISLETDGTILPKDALLFSLNLLTEHLNLVTAHIKGELPVAQVEETPIQEESAPPEIKTQDKE